MSTLQADGEETVISIPTIPHALLPFLQSQSQNTLNRLYQRPSSCLSIFRSNFNDFRYLAWTHATLRLLAPLERQIVMNLLWLDSAMRPSTMAAWVVREGKKIYDDALETLHGLHILSKSPDKLALNSHFKLSFRQAITAGGTNGSFGFPAEPDDKHSPPDIQDLDAYALERWETILHYMVSSGSGQYPSKPSKGVLYLLQQGGLMASQYGSAVQITSTGFQFLLHSPHEQLWSLLLQYLRMAEKREMDLVEVLSFLFMLSTMELGREYSADNLTETQKVLLEDLRDYGLVWQRKPSSRRFSPTRLATTLTSSSPPLPTSTGTSSGPQEGFIVLETNYRVYAYTDNPLQTAVLNLFVALKYRFPNLVVGSISRDSVKRALNNGISADQIISYLVNHAHPQMRKNNPLLPVTVQDQIRLWELEKNRTKSQDGYLYKDFASQGDYDLVLEYAKQINVVLWESSAKRCFFSSTDGHINIKNFIERRKGAM